MEATRRMGGALLLLVMFWPAGSKSLALQRDQQENSPLKLSTDLVSLNISVFDRNGNAALDLKKENFRIFENGVEQSLSFFSTDESPVSWGLVLDRSGSMQAMIQDVYRAALHVLDGGTEDDEMFIVTFSTRVALTADFTRDRRTLQNSIAGLRADGNTALYDAVAYSLDHMRLASHQKKVLVVVTDGEDNSSRMSFRSLVERAKEAGVQIYTIGMFESMDAMVRGDRPDSLSSLASPFNGWQRGRMGGFSKDELSKLSDVSGGLAHFPKSVNQCREAMWAIASEVNRQYAVGYYPNNPARDGKWRKLQVKIAPADGKSQYSARTRVGYYAPQGASGK